MIGIAPEDTTGKIAFDDAEPILLNKDLIDSPGEAANAYATYIISAVLPENAKDAAHVGNPALVDREFNRTITAMLISHHLWLHFQKRECLAIGGIFNTWSQAICDIEKARGLDCTDRLLVAAVKEPETEIILDKKEDFNQYFLRRLKSGEKAEQPEAVLQIESILRRVHL